MILFLFLAITGKIISQTGKISRVSPDSFMAFFFWVPLVPLLLLYWREKHNNKQNKNTGIYKFLKLPTCFAAGISIILYKHQRSFQNMTATACDHIEEDP